MSQASKKSTKFAACGLLIMLEASIYILKKVFIV